jgi:hypothetical protein
MSLVYKHGQRYGLIPRREKCNPLRFVRCKTISNYEAVILSPEQAYAVLVDLPEPERTLTLLAAVRAYASPAATLAGLRDRPPRRPASLVSMPLQAPVTAYKRLHEAHFPGTSAH